MYHPCHNCFRKDLIVVPDIKVGDADQYFWVKDPKSQATLKLNQQELFLCHLMDGNLTPAEILRRFAERFKQEIEISDFKAFSEFIAAVGFLGPYSEDQAAPQPVESESLVIAAAKLPKGGAPVRAIAALEPEASNKKSKKQKNPYQLILGNPDQALIYLATIFKLSPRSVWILFPAITGLAFLTVFNNYSILLADIVVAITTLPLALSLPISLILVNLTTKLAQGTVIRSFGAPVDEFGVELWFGFFPQFFVSRTGAKYLNRGTKLWVFATPLLFRLTLCAFGILSWFLIRTNESFLVTLSLLVVVSSLIGVLIDGCPLWKDSAYWWLTTYFRIGSLFDRSMQVWDMVLKRRSLPKNLSPTEKIALITYAAVSFLTSVAIFVILTYLISVSLEASLEGTGIILSGLLVTLVARWYFTMYHQGNNSNTVRPTDTAELLFNQTENSEPSKSSQAIKFLKRHKYTLLGIAGFAVLCALPYRYSPGGSITLLPPEQRDIQADISGRLVNVFVKGGDGQWLKKGTVIGEIEASKQLNPATPTNDDSQIKQEEVKQQEANLARRKAELDTLLNSPRPEQVQVAEAQLREAEEQLELAQRQLITAQRTLKVAEQQLQTQITSEDYRRREAVRLEELYKSGAIALQDYEEAQRLADVELSRVGERQQEVEVSKQRVEEAKQAVKAAQRNVEQRQADLNLVLSGPHPDEITAARKAVQAAEASLKVSQQELRSIDKQLRRSNLIMPIDGRITTPYLDQKQGTYIEQGKSFATAEDDRNIRSEMTLAQTDIGEFEIGKPVTVKLAAYPNDTITGHITSIEPATVEGNNGRFINVIVTLPNTERLLKSGMTGHAKIEGRVMPVIVVFTRPWVRFFQIEVWSWIP